MYVTSVANFAHTYADTNFTFIINISRIQRDKKQNYFLFLMTFNNENNYQLDINYGQQDTTFLSQVPNDSEIVNRDDLSVFFSP